MKMPGHVSKLRHDLDGMVSEHTRERVPSGRSRPRTDSCVVRL